MSAVLATEFRVHDRAKVPSVALGFGLNACVNQCLTFGWCGNAHVKFLYLGPVSLYWVSFAWREYVAGRGEMPADV